jgi:hypothetical protein
MMQDERDQKTGFWNTPRSSRPKSRRLAAGRHFADAGQPQLAVTPALCLV